MHLSRWVAPFAVAAAIAMAGGARAGVVNPNISVIGQPVAVFSDDKSSPDAKRVRLDVGEAEFQFDAYLNPYATGAFVVSLGEEGVDLEEGYFSLLRGLPAGLAVKGGKYRAGFGKLNPVHPHAYPFAERFRLLAAYLPGDESLNETGFSLSGRIPVPGEIAVTATGDVLQGDTFRIERQTSGDPSDPLEEGGDDETGQSRTAFVGRLSGFLPLGDRSGVELGSSIAQGTNNVAARARTMVYGGDVKAKLWRSDSSYLVLQGELVGLHRDDAGWDAATSAYTKTTLDALGGYAFADYQIGLRTDFGASYERYQEPAEGKPLSQAYGLFAGYSLLEETTVFRIGWERFVPEEGEAANTVTFRVLYSMGPHKAHQF